MSALLGIVHCCPTFQLSAFFGLAFHNQILGMTFFTLPLSLKCIFVNVKVISTFGQCFLCAVLIVFFLNEKEDFTDFSMLLPGTCPKWPGSVKKAGLCF